MVESWSDGAMERWSDTVRRSDFSQSSRNPILPLMPPLLSFSRGVPSFSSADNRQPTMTSPHPGVTLITPTGDRPLAFSLLERYMARQTYAGPIQWIVVDDGRTPTECTRGQTYLRRQPGMPGSESMRANLLATIEHVQHDKVLVIEDDEWYGPRYVELMAGYLDQADLAGEGPAFYYNVSLRWYRDMGNNGHAALCQTAFRARLLPYLAHACRKPVKFVDLELWRARRARWKFWEPAIRRRVWPRSGQCVGIKGMPGRVGISKGHRPPEDEYRQDPDGRLLVELIGAEDADVYLQQYGGSWSDGVME
jgi:hypothetical protein